MKASYIALSKVPMIVDNINEQKTIDYPYVKKNLNRMCNSQFVNSGNPHILPEMRSTTVCMKFISVPTIIQLSQ